MSVTVEQENSRDQLWFTLEIYPENAIASTRQTFCVYLDIGTTVALAQFQLLRDAINSDQFVVRVQFNYSDEDEDQATLFVYWLQLLRVDAVGGAASMSFSGISAGSGGSGGVVTVAEVFADYALSGGATSALHWRAHAP